MSALPVTRFGLIIHAYDLALKDKSYQACPVGREIGRYLRALRWSDATQNTLDTYEIVLSRLALDHDHFPGIERFCEVGGTEYLREFLERHWRDAATATKANRLAALRSFFKWAMLERGLPYNPAAAIKGPRQRDPERLPYPRATIFQLVHGQNSLRDEIALMLLARLALRKDELRQTQIRDVDLIRNILSVHGKGRKEGLLPLHPYPDLCEALYLHVQGGRRESSEYLLYPRNQRWQMMDLSTIHRWFKRCCERAELPTTIRMHDLRHFAGDVAAEDVRQLHAREPGPDPQIKMVHRTGLHPHQHLVFSRLRVGDVFIPQHFRPAKLMNANSFHRYFSEAQTSTKSAVSSSNAARLGPPTTNDRFPD